MPAIVRVKRRIDEEPLGAFVLNGKKRRLDENDASASANANGKDEISTILKFAGTLDAQDNDATSKYARLTKDAAQELIKQKVRKSTTTHTERARQEIRQSMHENRFRVVNCLRTTLGDSEDDDSAANAKALTIVDIEKQSTTPAHQQQRQHQHQHQHEHQQQQEATAANANDAIAPIASTSTDALAFAHQQQHEQHSEQQHHHLQQQQQQQQLLQPTDSDTGYVYDLYLPENEQQAEYVDLMDDNYLSVRACGNLVYEDCFNNSDDSDHDSNDSNEENYFANDYPDESDGAAGESGDESDGTRDLRKAVKNFVLDENDDDEDGDGGSDERDEDGEYCAAASSSDDDYFQSYGDPYVHTVDASDGNFVDDVDYLAADRDRYGVAYARYKARILKKLKQDDGPMGDDDGDEDAIAAERHDSSSDNGDYYD